MIRNIKIDHCPWKRNWIDQNNVVFGYSDQQDCCETFSWGVWNPETKVKVADDPDGMPYHFVFPDGVGIDEACFEDVEYPDVLDVVHVVMEHDEDRTKRLVFECWCNHNGYYYHDFSFETLEGAQSK